MAHWVESSRLPGFCKEICVSGFFVLVFVVVTSLARMRGKTSRGRALSLSSRPLRSNN